MTVSLYRCLESDQRISMDIYADGLSNALDVAGIEYQFVIPQSRLERFSHNSWVMRYLRYQYYPSYVAKNAKTDTQIHHVTDHGYAHLYGSLKSGIKCLSVHDLIPYLTWKGVIKKDQQGKIFNTRKPYLNLHSLKFIDRYDCIFTISQSTANDLNHYLGIPFEKINVIPPVIDARFVPESQDKVTALFKKYDLDTDCQWLMVSGCEYYKNHRTCLEVLKRLVEQYPIKLIKTGRPSEEFELMVNELGLNQSVRYLFLSDINELPTLYSAIDCLLFPSLYEGFGMPVAEALACGTPVVMSDRGALPEAGGSCAISCDPYDVDALSEAVISQLNRSIKQQMRQDGPLWGEQFRAGQIAKKVQAVYQCYLA